MFLIPFADSTEEHLAYQDSTNPLGLEGVLQSIGLTACLIGSPLPPCGISRYAIPDHMYAWDSHVLSPV